MGISARAPPADMAASAKGAQRGGPNGHFEPRPIGLMLVTISFFFPWIFWDMHATRSASRICSVLHGD